MKRHRLFDALPFDASLGESKQLGSIMEFSAI